MKKQIKASRRSLGMNYAIREVTVPAAEAARAGKKLLNLNIGDPNKWDFETPEYFKQTLREAVDLVDNGYGDSQGQLDLRKAVVRREKEKNGKDDGGYAMESLFHDGSPFKVSFTLKDRIERKKFHVFMKKRK